MKSGSHTSVLLTREFYKQSGMLRYLVHLARVLGGGMALLLLRLLSPIVQIRIGKVMFDRIGHLASNTEYWLRTEHQTRGPREYHVLLSSPHPANRQLLTMIKRRVFVLESSVLMGIHEAIREKFPQSPVWLTLNTPGTHDYKLWSNSDSQLRFTQTEIKKGEALLRSIGIPPGAPFVCFAIRDHAYLDQNLGRGTDQWRYHDYRDADVENCRLMAEWLAAQGLWVLRMGAAVAKPFLSENPRIIDYATHHRTDFGDIFLSGHCKFFVGDTAGLFWVSGILGVPVALTNLVPITHLYPVSGSMVLVKRYRRIGDGRMIPYRDVIAMGADGFLRGDQYAEAGIELLENTPEEILGMVQELNARIDGTWKSYPEDEDLHDRFWSIFPHGHPSHGCPARMPIDFLRRNRDLLI